MNTPHKKADECFHSSLSGYLNDNNFTHRVLYTLITRGTDKPTDAFDQPPAPASAPPSPATKK